MSDLIPVIIFIACLLATLGLVRVCDWLCPASPAGPTHPAGAAAPRNQEAAR